MIKELSARLLGNASVFFAELEAIKLISNKISSTGGYNNMRFIKFFVDSQAALMVLMDKSNIRSIQVRDTCWALDKLGGWQRSLWYGQGHTSAHREMKGRTT